MDEELSLPPAFKACALPPDADPSAEGAAVLAPEGTLRASLAVIYPLMQAFGDALGSVLPPRVAVHYGWPDRIFVNGGLAGALRLEAPTGDLDNRPDWLLASVALDIMGGTLAEPGMERDRTSLYGEGITDVGPRPMLEAFARYFLVWLSRWEERGLAALESAWIGRVLGYEAAHEFYGPNGVFEARVKALDGPNGVFEARVKALARDGNLVLETAGRRRVLDIGLVLDAAGWREFKRI
jgi:hypothetical protein